MNFNILYNSPVINTTEGFTIDIEVSHSYGHDDIRENFEMSGLTEDQAKEIIGFLENNKRTDNYSLENNEDFKRIFGWKNFYDNGFWPYDRTNGDNPPCSYVDHKVFFVKDGKVYPVEVTN